MSSASVMADGSTLIGMTEERPDESADEFYRISIDWILTGDDTGWCAL